MTRWLVAGSAAPVGSAHRATPAPMPLSRPREGARRPNVANRCIADHRRVGLNANDDVALSQRRARLIVTPAPSTRCGGLPVAPQKREGSDAVAVVAHSEFVMEMSPGDPEALWGVRSVDRLNSAPLWLLDQQAGQLFVCAQLSDAVRAVDDG